MFHIYTNFKSIDVKYGSKYLYPNKSIIPLFSNKDNALKSIYVSSPKLIVPWNKTLSENGKRFNMEFANNNHTFTKKLRDFCCQIVSHKIIKDSLKDHNLDISSLIDIHQIRSYANDALTLRFFDVKIEDVCIYDELGYKLSIHDIEKDDNVKILFHINNVMIKESKIQVDMKLIQILKISPYMQVNKTMNLLSDKQLCNISNTMTQSYSTMSHRSAHTPMPPPPPMPPNAKPKDTSNKSSLSSISIEELLSARLKLRKR